VLIGVGGNSDRYAVSRAGEAWRAFEAADITKLTGKDLVSVQGQFVGSGGAQAVFRLATFFARRDKDATLRTGPKLSFHEMKDHPTVVIGAYSNPLTWGVSRNLRFYFDDPGNGYAIRDRQEPSKTWGTEYNAKNEAVVDHALISRVLNSETGQFLVIASGLTGESCVSAADFVTSEAPLANLMRQAPADWGQMNFQAVLRSRIVGQSTTSPEVVRVHFWR